MKFCAFADEAHALLDSGTVDAVLIATPHFDHPSIAVKAFEKGLHVLCEKPIGVYGSQAREMVEAAHRSGKKFAVMFNQRTSPLYRKARELGRSWRAEAKHVDHDQMVPQAELLRLG